MRRVLGNAMISGATLGLLLLLLIAVDDRVREQVTIRIHNPRPAAAGLERAGEQASDLIRVVGDSARQQAVEHAPLLLFAFAGTVLVLFMLRM